MASTIIEPARWLPRIFGLLVLMFILQAVAVWQNQKIQNTLDQIQEKMPSVTVPVSITKGGTTFTVPLTTTQGEFDPDETENDWIDRTEATAANLKTRMEQT